MLSVSHRLMYLFIIAAYFAIGTAIYNTQRSNQINLRLNEVSNFINFKNKKPNNENFKILIPKMELQEKTIAKKENKELPKAIHSVHLREKFEWKIVKYDQVDLNKEIIKLNALNVEIELPKNLTSYYRELDLIKDEIKLAQSAIGKEEEPLFYDYSSQVESNSLVNKKAKIKNVKTKFSKAVDNKAQAVEAVDNKDQVVEAVNNKAKAVEAVDNKAQVVEAVDNKAQVVEAVDNKAQAVEAVDNKAQAVEAVDNKAQAVEAVENYYEIVESIDINSGNSENKFNDKKIEEAVDNKAQFVEAVDNKARFVEAVDNKAQFVEAVDNEAQFVEAVDNKAKDVDEFKINNSRNNHDLIAFEYSKKNKNDSKKQNAIQKKTKQAEKNEYSSISYLKAIGTDLSKIHSLSGFEVMTSENEESFMDYNQGLVKLEDTLRSKKNNRSIVINKLGYVSTHAEITMEEGWTEAAVPLIEKDKFDELIQKYESQGPVGILLVELDEETKNASIDVPYGEVINFDENFNVTKENGAVYKIFIGVQAGNTLLSYETLGGELVSKIVHIHESATTFDSNFYEEVKTDFIKLFEEDLLSKELSPLNIQGEQLKVFAKKQFSQKINSNTYKISKTKKILGSRNYLELNHLEEPVFVGYQHDQRIVVPSENFMRQVIGNIKGNSISNSCVIQINLRTKVEEALFLSESVLNFLNIQAQYLDKDGKFYDSPGPNTEKMFLLGENMGSEKINQDSKINLKIKYVDGASEFLSTYCSPNSYLVEQL